MIKTVILTTGTPSPWLCPDDWNASSNTVEFIGGGGGGGAGYTDGTNSAGGGGGGGGAYRKYLNHNFNPGTDYSFTVGVGGAVGAAGGTTLIGGMGAYGGLGGASAPSGTSPGAGGAGGSYTGMTSGGAGESGGTGNPALGGGGGGTGGPNGIGEVGPNQGYGGAGDSYHGGTGGNIGTTGGNGTEMGGGLAGAGGGGGGGSGSGVFGGGAAGGLYGGGGGGGGAWASPSGNLTYQGNVGAPGVIVITYTPVPTSSGMSLFLTGSAQASGSMSLYTTSYLWESGSTTLYVAGDETVQSGVTLYTQGASTNASGLSLFVGGEEPVLSGLTLYTEGYLSQNGSFPLHLHNPTTPFSSHIPLSLYATSSSGFFGGISLFVESLSGVSNVASGHMNLFACSPAQFYTTFNMNLWERGRYGSVNNFLQLLVCNTSVGTQSGVTLFVGGDGITPGAIPYSADMNLFLRRAPSDAMTLYVLPPGTTDASGVFLYAWGFNNASGWATLTMKDVVGSMTSTLKLVTRGL